MYKLDNRDIKILNVIADNARLPYSKIAKLTKISKDSVKARIDNLIKERIIMSFSPFIDYNKLGYHLFQVYIKLDTSLKNEERFLKNSINNGFVVTFTKLIGKCDFTLQVLARDVFHEYEILNNILKGFRGDITDIRVLTTRDIHKYTMLVEKSPQTLSKIIQNKPKNDYKIDEIDLVILKILSLNARDSLLNISKKAKISPELARYRINNLIKRGVINGFYTKINKFKFGLTMHAFLLDINTPINKGDIQFFHSMNNIFYSKSCLGNWNLVISFYAKDNYELFDTIYKIRNHFEQRLNRYDLFILLREYKSAAIPAGISIIK